ncbi:MAG TPA: FHA domain-containing protein, partial [Pirellulaceae bacterium]|nr:FHA domain-containing protein [Pirellulaceae bacterium]
MTTNASREPSSGRRQLFEPAANETHLLDRAWPFLVGRSQNAGLPLFDPACARQQFQLVERDEQVWLEPLSDRSPTLVNGRRAVEPVSLTHGAVIQAGATQLIYLERDD